MLLPDDSSLPVGMSQSVTGSSPWLWKLNGIPTRSLGWGNGDNSAHTGLGPDIFNDLTSCNSPIIPRVLVLRELYYGFRHSRATVRIFSQPFVDRLLPFWTVSKEVCKRKAASPIFLLPFGASVLAALIGLFLIRRALICLSRLPAAHENEPRLAVL